MDSTEPCSIGHDNLNRLIQVAEGVPGDVAIPVEDYAYDEEGNRLASHLSNLYTSNAHNQLLEDEDYTYAYDERGNRVSRTAKADGAVERYSYDSQNRLVGYVSPTTTASYAYDAMDRRIAKTVDGTVLSFFFDIEGARALKRDDVLLAFTSTNTNAALTRRWLTTHRIDENLAYEQYIGTNVPGSGTEFSLIQDRFGSVTSVIKAPDF